MPKKLTIDDLARMVKEGFDEVTDAMARKDALEAFQRWTMRRFDLIETDLKIIKKQLDRVVYRHEFEKLETPVKDIEDLLAVVTKRR